MMRKKQLLDYSISQKRLGGVGSSRKGPVFSPKKSVGRSKSQKSPSVHEVTIKETPHVFKFNLSLEHQHVKASFMDTSKKVAQLREAAMEKREELRRKKEESKERLGGIIP